MLLARWSNIYQCLLGNFQAPIYKNLLMGKSRVFWAFRAATIIYMIQWFHLYYSQLALIQRFLLIVTTTRLLKALEDSWALKVIKLATVVSQYFKYIAE